MRISQADWIRYIDRLAEIDNIAATKVIQWVEKNGLNDLESLTAYAYAVSTKYGEASAALAAEMYDATAAAAGVAVPTAEVAATATYDDVARAIHGTAKRSENPNYIGNSIGRLVKRAGADTTLKNAERDGAQFAWVPMGDTCAFCLTLASRGWQYMSKKAMKGGHAEHIHANCDCTYAVRFDGKSSVQGYNPDKYLKMYYGAEGSTPKDRINAMRREQYAADPEKYRAQKRRVYAGKNNQPNDVTDEWISNIKNNTESIIDNIDSVKLNDTTYRIEPGHVFIDHDIDEKNTASLLSRATGETVTLCPRITGRYKGVSTPDYLVGKSNEKWDRKALNGSGKDALRDVLKKEKKQASNFIIDISKWKGTDSNILDQAEMIFKRKNTEFVETIAITKGDEIIKVISRKK